MKQLLVRLRMINWRVVLPFLVVLSLFFLNSFHEKYPDEFDSIVGGKYILEGKVPYRDWFQHHQPGAYVYAAMLLPFAFGSFVKLRVLIGLGFFAIVAFTYAILRKRVPQFDGKYYFLFAITLGFAGTYFWGQMLLADTLSAYLFIPAYALLLYKDFYRVKFEQKDLFVVTFFGFLVWFTSMTYLFAVGGLVLYALYLYWKDNDFLHKNLKKGIWTSALTVGTPYIMYFGFWFLTGSLKDWYFANVIYNQEYYIFNYPRAPGAAFNPIRYAIIIANTFVNNYLPALWGFMQFPIGDPLQVTLAFSNAVFLAVLLMTGRWQFIFPFVIALIFVNGRSNPMQIKETDYWASVYIVLSFINGVFALNVLRDRLNNAKEVLSNKVIAGALFLALGVYWVFTPAVLFLRMENRFFPKYMGTAPLIYDRPQVAPIVNQLVTKDEYAWVGPFNFEELFYLNTKIPSKHHWFLDPAAKSKIKDEIMVDFETNRPKVVVFVRDYAPWGGDPHTFNYFMTDFLDQNYFRLMTLNSTLTDVQYKWKLAKTENFDFDANFNFDKKYQNELLEKLLNLGYIEKIPKGK